MSGVLWSSIRGGCGMRRTEWLQDRRMQKFRDVLSRWERRELSALEAGELLGCSERQFRRYRARYERKGLTGRLTGRSARPRPNRGPGAGGGRRMGPIGA